MEDDRPAPDNSDVGQVPAHVICIDSPAPRLDPNTGPDERPDRMSPWQARLLRGHSPNTGPGERPLLRGHSIPRHYDDLDDLFLVEGQAHRKVALIRHLARLTPACDLTRPGDDVA